MMILLGLLVVVTGLLVVVTSSRLHPHTAADPSFSINAKLGIGGFPDCVRRHPLLNLSLAEADADLFCRQKVAPKDAVRIGCIGDSITAGVDATDAAMAYPGQLQTMLDDAHGAGAYSVTNLGACGSTMLKKSNSPYWERPQMDALKNGKWDIITIMLGTNDAKDPGSHGPDNWQHNCGGVNHTTTTNCSYAEDYKAMVELVRTLGTGAGAPQVWAMIPPPLMALFSIGANQTVINTVYPKLIPLIATDNALTGTIDIFSGMGGVPDWQKKFPANCALDSSWAPCKWWCDAQACDDCHPNNDGYTQLASVLKKGLGL